MDWKKHNSHIDKHMTEVLSISVVVDTTFRGQSDILPRIMLFSDTYLNCHLSYSSWHHCVKEDTHTVLVI